MIGSAGLCPYPWFWVTTVACHGVCPVQYGTVLILAAYEYCDALVINPGPL